jgi:phospholipid transport system substrate-binding protein
MRCFLGRAGRSGWARTTCRFLLCVALATGLLARAPIAQAVTPTETLQQLYAEANRLLGRPTSETQAQERLPAIRQLFARAFDFRGAAERALGGQWQARTAAEQNDFTSLFAGFVQRGFVFWLASVASINGDPGGVAVTYLGEKVTKDRAEVRTSLGARGGRQVLLDYDMVYLKKAWVVDDVTIDGISLVANYRAQFDRVIRAGSYGDLVERMRERTATEIPKPAAARAAPVEPDISRVTPREPDSSRATPTEPDTLGLGGIEGR